VSAAEPRWETFPGPSPRVERPAADAITGGDLCRLADMNPNLVSRWCVAGVFGPEHAASPGSGNYRRFDPGAVLVARACRRAARELGEFAGVPTWILVAVADQVRSGADVVRVRLGDHVELTVDVSDLREDQP
jgi:hypothetical protein